MPAAQPNVLLICVDQWPGSLLGVAGHPCLMTPNLDRLAASGVLFTNAYSAAPVCTAARRGLMTGLTPRSHGDRVYSERLPMPDVPTLAETFCRAGYQAYAVGELHVFPPRSRIGFCDVILDEAGRRHLGTEADDYELFLAAEGYVGQEYTHAISANSYMTRTWHLPEYLHPTNWTVYEMCRTIKRRDPTRPALWYMSFRTPHPPLVPPAPYMDLYRDAAIPEPYVGDWAADPPRLPYALQVRRDRWPPLKSPELRLARQAFYAACTHIDHQIALVIGTLREEGLLDDTIICFLSDHGDMLGNHGLYAKQLFYQDSARIPLIIVPTADYRHLGHHRVDDRLVEIRDVMPTLLDMAGIAVPGTVEGVSLISGARRDHLYGEMGEGDVATRMLRSLRFKLVYYAAGNRSQLFDLQEDPNELHDLSDDPAHAGVRQDLTRRLVEHLYGDDQNWVKDGALVGLPDRRYEPGPDRGLNNQRGWRFAGSVSRATTRV